MNRYIIIGLICLMGLVCVSAVYFSVGEALEFEGFFVGLDSVSGEVSFDPNDNRTIGYEFLDDGKVVHIWNTQDDYFFNKSSGIQLTNHFEDYWTKNIFCGGYIDSNPWICLDDLPFTWDIQTDNLTYVNYTGYEEINLAGAKLRLSITYHLNLNDKNITITPKVENIGNKDVIKDLGFAWKITDWDIPPSERGDYIKVNNTNYFINDFNDDVIFKEVDNAFIKGFDARESLRLDWDENSNYSIEMYGNGTKEDFYITLLINIGNLSKGEEKQTTFQWIDLLEVDAISDGTDSGTVDLTIQHTTTGTTENSILIVTVQVTDASETDRIIQSVTHNGDDLINLNTSADDAIEQRTEIWYRINPDVGTNLDIVATGAGSMTDLTMGAISLTGVDTDSFPSILENLVDDYDDTGTNFNMWVGGSQEAIGQSFTGNGGLISSATFDIKKFGAPTGDVVAKLYAHSGTFGASSVPTGTALATSDALDVSTLTTSFQTITFTFPSPSRVVMNSGVNYVIVIEYSTGGDSPNHLQLEVDITSPSHGGNFASFNSPSWTANSGQDVIFSVFSIQGLAIASGIGNPTLDITTGGDSSFVVDSLASAESMGTKIVPQWNTIHKTDVGGDTHASQYVDAGGAGVQVMNYSDTDADKQWVLSAVAIRAFVEAGDNIPPTWSDNQTNGTTANTEVTFAINYTDETALSPNGGYIFSTNNTGAWVNETLIMWTTTPSWANITKVLPANAGNRTDYRWYANDSAGNINNSDVFNVVTTSPVADTCTYGGSGLWSVDCGDICNITSDVDMDNNNISLHNTGEFNIRAWLNDSYQMWIFDSGCNVNIYKGGLASWWALLL